MEKISTRLKYAMDFRGYSSVDLCRETGISTSSICLYLKDSRLPKQDKIFAIAEALNVDEGWLMGYDAEMSRRPRNEEPPAPTLTPDEIELIRLFRSLPSSSRFDLIASITAAAAGRNNNGSVCA